MEVGTCICFWANAKPEAYTLVFQVSELLPDAVFEVVLIIR